MPAALYLRLTTPSGSVIAGDSTNAKFKGWIALENWRFNVALDEGDNSTNAKEASAGKPGKPGRSVPSVLSFSKLMDRSTTAMLTHIRWGTKLKAEIVLEDSWALQRGAAAKELQTDQQFHLTIELTDARLTSYSVDLSAPSDQAEAFAEEDWTLDYSKITFDTLAATKKDAKGVKEGEKPGRVKVTLERPPDASTDEPDDQVGRLFKMAGKLEVGQLTDLWQKLQKEAERRQGLGLGK